MKAIMKFPYDIISVRKQNNIIITEPGYLLRILAGYELDESDFIPGWVRDWPLRHHAQPGSGLLPDSYQIHS
jgi:hypothetical protein